MTTIQNNQKKISMPGEPQARNISPNVAGKKEFFEQNAFNQASSPNEPTGAHLSAQQEGQKDRFKDARSKFLNGMVDASSPKIGEPINAHRSAKQEGQQDRFKDAKGVFENGNTNAPKVGKPIDAHRSAQQEGQKDRFKDAKGVFENGNTNAPKVGKPIDAHRSAQQEGQKDRFKDAKGVFENGNTNAPKVGEPTDAQEFKHKVKMSGIIHTSTRRNNFGGGLNEVPKNVTKKTNSATPIQRTDSTSSLSSVEDANHDTSAYNVNGRKKVMFADPIESVATGPEVKQQLPETQRIIDNAEQRSELLKAGMEAVPFIPKERSDSDVSSRSASSVDSQPKAPANQAEIDRAMRENNEVASRAGDELETVKFLKTLSKGEREKLGFSSKQPKNRNLVRCSITHEYNMITPTIIRSSDNHISPRQGSILERDRITHEVSTEPKLERSSNNKVSPKQESNREMCGVTRNKTKNAFNNKPPLSTFLETGVEGSKKGSEKDSERGSRSC